MSTSNNRSNHIQDIRITPIAFRDGPLLNASGIHEPWQEEEVFQGGRITFVDGAVKVPTTPGLGVTIDPVQLAKLHQQYLDCGVRNRNDLAQMRKYDPTFSGVCPRF